MEVRRIRALGILPDRADHVAPVHDLALAHVDARQVRVLRSHAPLLVARPARCARSSRRSPTGSETAAPPPPCRWRPPSPAGRSPCRRRRGRSSPRRCGSRARTRRPCAWRRTSPRNAWPAGSVYVPPPSPSPTGNENPLATGTGCAASDRTTTPRARAAVKMTAAATASAAPARPAPVMPLLVGARRDRLLARRLRAPGSSAGVFEAGAACAASRA